MPASPSASFTAALKQPVALPKWAIGTLITALLFLLTCFALSPSAPSEIRLRGVEASIPTRQELGRATWTFLHRMAAQYESEPGPATKERMSAFIHSLGQFYPCHTCAEHFREMLEATPPDVSGSSGLATWMCARHNEVNARLGKAQFPCDVPSLEARWGDCGCGEEPTPPSDPSPEH